MSSEQEDGPDHPDGLNVNFDANVDQSPEEKGNGPREHAKPRRRRRGKKRKHKKESAAACEAVNPEECESELHVECEHADCDSPAWGTDENLTRYYDSFSDVIIRPVNVPMAPLNSTQFIMDDHDDCRFYMSFETPNPYGETDSHLDKQSGDIIEPIGEDAAYIDIDYQYESPQDFDNSAYYDKEFELSYKNNRFEELMRLSRSELIKKLQTLESRSKELSEDLVKENPSPVLEKLQAELLDLQEKNTYLKECNTKLKCVLQDTTNCSETVNEDVFVSSLSHDEHESDDSVREVYEECNEVVMLDSKNVCDKSHENEMDDIAVENSNYQVVDHSAAHNDLIRHNEGTNPAVILNVDCTDEQVSRSENSNTVSGTSVSVGKTRLVTESQETENTSCTTILNCEDKLSKHIHSNSRVLHCQPNSLVSDDLRTLNIISNELFHNTNQTKCSSSVPLEGGMSPSETSVN